MSLRRITDGTKLVVHEAVGTLGDVVRNLFLAAITLALAFIFGAGLFLIWTTVMR